MKKKINKKGFTLVELLAVVVILLAISVIAISSISAAIERQNVKKNNAVEKFIKNYADTYFDDFKNTAIVNGKGCVDVSVLESKYSLDETALRDSDNNYMGGCVLYISGELEYKKNDHESNTYYGCNADDEYKTTYCKYNNGNLEKCETVSIK